MMNVFAALPEIFLTAMIMLILLVDAFNQRGNTTLIKLLTLVALIGAYILERYVYNPTHNLLAFNDMFVLDSLAFGMKVFTYIMAVFVVIYIHPRVVHLKEHVGAFYSIFLFAILGMLVMISANNLLVLYVGLELLSLALYGIVALERDKVTATEAAMKFFILGALASGILLYGISFIYGGTGGLLQIGAIAQYLNDSGVASTGVGNNFILIFGLVFIVAGLMFKLGLVPFHMWIPDVYQGSEMPATTIIATVTKLAAVVFVIRFLIVALIPLSASWSVMLAILAFLSIFLGNIVAIAQTNIKRMLGYSTIAHMGFVAFGLMGATLNGVSAVLFYTVTYAFTMLLVFGVLLLLSKDGHECSEIADLQGLNKSHPVYAGIMLIAMFSLAGIPPLVGFYAKFRILQVLVADGYVRSAIFAVIMSLIGAFYYLRVVKVMYFDEAVAKVNVNSGLLNNSLLMINAVFLVIVGLLPNNLMELCTKFITG